VDRDYGGNMRVLPPLEYAVAYVVVYYIIIIIAAVDLEVNPNEVRDTRYVSPEELNDMFKQEGRSVATLKSRFGVYAMVSIDL
jgi:isopentenyldiphosphate isomerase